MGLHAKASGEHLRQHINIGSWVIAYKLLGTLEVLCSITPSEIKLDK
jgi:hypothetical protein